VVVVVVIEGEDVVEVEVEMIVDEVMVPEDVASSDSVDSAESEFDVLDPRQKEQVVQKASEVLQASQTKFLSEQKRRQEEDAAFYEATRFSTRKHLVYGF